MARKRWEAKTEITPELIKFRDKRKWQIALRRYVIEKSLTVFYAPYFGLDIENLRKWFEYQFTEGLNWENFGKAWQFEHVIPLSYFNIAEEAELKMCWSFVNLRVEALNSDKGTGNRVDILGAKAYFQRLFEKTGYKHCKDLIDKIESVEKAELLTTTAQESFLVEHLDYLKEIEGYNSFEFELLNNGRSIESLKKEMEFLKKYSP